MKSFELKYLLKGQCTSGKNSVIVTRSGNRFPSSRFIKWRKDMMNQILPQINNEKVKLPVDFPVNIRVEYTAEDKRRRDIPGIMDALWHLLEKVGIISDDTFLGGWKKYCLFLNKGVNPDKCGVIISLRGNYGDTGNMQIQKKQPKIRGKRKIGGSSYTKVK